MGDEELLGCICCMSSNDLCDLFAVDSENKHTYLKMIETCFGIKVDDYVKYICTNCIVKLEISANFKEQTVKSLADLKSKDAVSSDVEYLDENILEEETNGDDSGELKQECDDIDDDHTVQSLDETRCVYCELQLSTVEEAHDHIQMVHEMEPRTGLPLKKCLLCGQPMTDPAEHVNQCQNIKTEMESRQYYCHFCENIYSSKKACFTHLRMKHGLKFTIDQTTKSVSGERKKCPMCTRDFSQKQILNKHLWKVHGLEVEKRKAFICPLCDERVSYGSHFSAHLLHTHKVCEQVEQLEFYNMDDFLLFKSAIQEETKYRFRKTTASKQTIEGIRSHYMCSQSGVYVYQGKGKRPAPERQIYKTGKACPAHMIVTETLDRVLVTFYKTHVGHGPCPYYEPREPKKIKTESTLSDYERGSEEQEDGGHAWICDSCGLRFFNALKFNKHVASHGLNKYPCHYCGEDFRDIEAWTEHVQNQHNAQAYYKYNNYNVM